MRDKIAQVTVGRRADDRGDHKRRENGRREGGRESKISLFSRKTFQLRFLTPIVSRLVSPFGAISPRRFSFHGVITICSVPGQRVLRRANPATRFYSRVPRDDEIPPACLRALLWPSKSCKKPSRGRGAISICACSKLPQRTPRETACIARASSRGEKRPRYIRPRKEEFLCRGERVNSR